MCAYVSANFQCSQRAVPFCIICSLHLITVGFLHAIWLLKWSLQLPSFLTFYVSRGLAGCSNTSLRTFCFDYAVTWSLPSTCHLQYDWYSLALLQLAHTISRICCHQSKCFAARFLPCCDMIPHILLLILIPHILSMSSPLHHLSCHCVSVLICIQAPVSFFSCFWPFLVLYPTRSNQMLNDDFDKLIYVPHGTVFSTWELPLDSSVGTTLCLPSDLK